MIYPNRKLNIVNSPKLAYNMNYDVAKQCYYSCKEKWLLFKKQPVNFFDMYIVKIPRHTKIQGKHHHQK